MVKLVFTYHWSVPHEAEGTDTIPFEYVSKDEFVYDVLEQIKVYRSENTSPWPENDVIRIDVLDREFNIEDLLHGLEYNTCTLDEWFERNKTNKI